MLISHLDPSRKVLVRMCVASVLLIGPPCDLVALAGGNDLGHRSSSL
jgi:hypothetical protein